MTTYKNNVKTAVLLAALFGLLIWVGSYWGAGGMMVAGTFALLMNVGAWFFSDKIAVAAMRGRAVDENSELYRIVQPLAQRAKLPMPRVYICPQEAPNALYWEQLRKGRINTNHDQHV